ncbi:hypothetical protein THTE_1747 [Thermogutta terrifontis]|uniref:HTH cro/C1-type domain-containing protein n=1 Tax=Thermogutta terrifontis TaxID=1331910 RepID=A0A286REE6_9BACT|nr:helix-turn-helix transcriptional regulator [Thermogutta terrifontis]ASV74349.1 hypothetical protein THTE_1747 [Thermogutta terrifontis]
MRRWKSLRRALMEKLVLSGLTWQAVADLTGVSRAAVSRFIAGRDLRLTNIEKLMRHFRLEVVECDSSDAAEEQAKV